METGQPQKVQPSTDPASPRAGRRGGRSVAHGLRRSRRRHRRTLRPRRSLSRTRLENQRLRSRRNRDDPPLAKHVHLHFHEGFFRLLLVLFPLGDAFAQVARMRAIQRRLHRGRERIRVRPLDDHPRPRDRLQQRPMPADAREQCENHDETAGFAKNKCHGREGSGSRVRVNRRLLHRRRLRRGRGFLRSFRIEIRREFLVGELRCDATGWHLGPRAPHDRV